MTGVTQQMTVFVESASKPVFFPAKDSDLLDLISFEMAQNTLGKIMIYVIMNACAHFPPLILINTSYKHF